MACISHTYTNADCSRASNCLLKDGMGCWFCWFYRSTTPMLILEAYVWSSKVRLKSSSCSTGVLMRASPKPWNAVVTRGFQMNAPYAKALSSGWQGKRSSSQAVYNTPWGWENRGDPWAYLVRATVGRQEFWQNQPWLLSPRSWDLDTLSPSKQIDIWRSLKIADGSEGKKISSPSGQHGPPTLSYR